jgi:hypothetical protein
MSHQQVSQPIMAMDDFLLRKSRISSSANCMSHARLRFQPAPSGCDPQPPAHDTAVWEGTKHDHACRGECLALHSGVGAAPG